MIRMLLERVLERKLEGMSFPGQVGVTAGETTRAVFAAFGAGARACLRKLGPPAVAALEAETPWHRRCFFWEGYAFALAGFHACRFARGNPDGDRIIGHFRAMHYTGYGFWNGVAMQQHLPRVSLRPERWASVADYEQLCPLIAGGVGFAVTGFAGGFSDAVARKLTLQGDPGWTRAAVQGCGRALWFLYMHNVERLEDVVTAHPEFSDELAEGIGVAIAFTHLATPPAIAAAVERFDRRLHEGLMRGVGLCLYEVTVEDPRVTPHIDAIADERLRSAYALCEQAAREVAVGPGWYWRYARFVRARSALAPAGAQSRASGSPSSTAARDRGIRSQGAQSSSLGEPSTSDE